jgi:hypothetical protein
MTFTQHIEACDDEAHGECTVISCDTDEDLLDPDTGAVDHPAGTILWRMHQHAAVHAEHRINRDYPALDHRGDGAPTAVSYSEPCAGCAPYFPDRGDPR